MKEICANEKCGKEFTVHHPTQLYCSKRCRRTVEYRRRYAKHFSSLRQRGAA